MFNNYQQPNRRNNNIKPTNMDFGPKPYALNLKEKTLNNDFFRSTLWTGCNLQLTVMSILPGDCIGLENHPHLDQFIYIESGHGLVKMGECKNNLNFECSVFNNYAFIIPAGTWHNLINTGCCPIKLFSVYAPPQHPKGTINPTKYLATDED